MKRLLIFLALKVVEAWGACAVLIGMAWVGNVSLHLTGHPWASESIFDSAWTFIHCLAGALVHLFMLLAALVLGGLAIYGIYRAIKANWRWAGNLTIHGPRNPKVYLKRRTTP